MAGQTTEEQAGALVRRGAEELSAGRVDEALAAFGEVVSRFGAHADPAVLTHVADAMEARAKLLADAGRPGEAIEAADAYVRRFGLAGELTPRIRSQLGSVLSLKAVLLVPADRDAAREIVDQVVRLCRADPDPLVRARAAVTLDRYARALAGAGDLDAAAGAFGEIPACFCGDDEDRQLMPCSIARSRFVTPDAGPNRP